MEDLRALLHLRGEEQGAAVSNCHFVLSRRLGAAAV
jgi:hypothetical protein